MRIYRDIDVFEAALARIRWVFDEFGRNVVVAFSGGKDSTCVLNLAHIVATERNELPLKVMWIDQEAEWQAVVDYARTALHRPGIEPWWFQMPMKISNSTSEREDWLHCWAPGEEWMRPREPDSIHENTFGTDRFYALFDAILARKFTGQKACILGGVRAEESPTRAVALTQGRTYKHVTWGKKLDGNNQFTFYPIFDWSYRDVWLAIHRNRWAYYSLYDRMYQHGVPVRDMRVSNVHHETAISHLAYLQDFEADTWARLTKRLAGVNTMKHLGADFTVPDELPSMFESWVDYRDHLLKHLIADPSKQSTMRAKFKAMDTKYSTMHHKEPLWRAQVNTVLVGDHFGTKLANFENNPAIVAWRQYQNGKRHPQMARNPHIHGTDVLKRRAKR